MTERAAAIGRSIPQLDGPERVSGRTDFVINMALPGMLNAKVVRSPLPHARIAGIDTTKAMRVPGVVAILTRDDFATPGAPTPNYGRMFMDQDVVALTKVRYIGDPVAAVAATSETAADEAAALVDVEYEPLPAVFSLDDALADDAPILHSPRPRLRPGVDRHFIDVGGETNLCSRFVLRRGDVGAALERATHVRVDEFTTSPVQHVALEPHAVIADCSSGMLTVWTSAQMPHAVRAQLAEMFQLPLTRVRVVVGPVGGGFGAKGGVKLEPLVACLAWKTGRPVRLVLTRAEEFVTLTRHASRFRITTGLSADGHIVARRVVAHYNTGAYADVGPGVARNAGVIMGGPYRVPNMEIESYSVWTNLVPAGAFRGFGVPQACWAYECHTDALAEQAGLDPFEFRERNILRRGDRHVTGEELDDIQYPSLLDAAAQAIEWSSGDARWRRLAAVPVSKPGASDRRARGKGLALVLKATITPSTSSAILRMNADGSLNVLSSGVDIGQGTKTVLAQIAADAVGVPIEAVMVSDPDTAVTPFDQQTSSSRVTFSVGNAIRVAARELRDELLDLASEALEIGSGDLELGDGAVAVRGSPERRLGYAQLVARSRKGSLVADGSFTTHGELRTEDGQGHASVHWHQGAAGCEVEVDLETGRVTLERLYVAAYVGRAINPRMCELQIEGSALFALGQALFEEIVYDEGRVSNANLSDYTIPSSRDVPQTLRALVLEGADDAEIHGVGETALPPVLAAIGNAIYNATGTRLTGLPMSPERSLSGLRHKTAD